MAQCIIAFASAWLHRHLSSDAPASNFPSILSLHLVHPPSKQFVTPGGVPLYPVANCLLFLTITAPTCLVQTI